MFSSGPKAPEVLKACKLNGRWPKVPASKFLMFRLRTINKLRNKGSNFGMRNQQEICRWVVQTNPLGMLVLGGRNKNTVFVPCTWGWEDPMQLIKQSV